METVTAFIKRRPALSYFALTFAISWGGLLLVIGGPGAIRGTAEQIGRLWLPALLATFAGPPIASILLTGIVAGRAGLRELRARLLRWRVGLRWYAIALLTAPVLVSAILLALSLSSAAFIPGIIVASDKLALVLFGVTWGLVGGGLLEELGWTGFAVPSLRQRYDALTTALIVGLLWGAWHLPITFWVMSGSAAGGLTLAAFLPVFVFFHFGALPAYRVLLVWLHDRTASLPAVMLMHASYSASRMILNPLAIAGVALATYDLVSAAVLWIVAAAVAVASRGKISRPPLRPQAV
jgi:membrane protease YdiL (CAAX protease family)